MALNWPKLAWCKVRWNVYTMYAVQLICTNFLLFFICIMLYLTNLFYRYTKNRAHKCRNTRTNSFFTLIKSMYKDTTDENKLQKKQPRNPRKASNVISSNCEHSATSQPVSHSGLIYQPLFEVWKYSTNKKIAFIAKLWYIKIICLSPFQISKCAWKPFLHALP